MFISKEKYRELLSQLAAAENALKESKEEIERQKKELKRAERLAAESTRTEYFLSRFYDYSMKDNEISYISGNNILRDSNVSVYTLVTKYLFRDGFRLWLKDTTGEYRLVYDNNDICQVFWTGNFPKRM